MFVVILTDMDFQCKKLLKQYGESKYQSEKRLKDKDKERSGTY